MSTKHLVSTEVKFLGYIVTVLCWDKYVNHVCKKINSACYGLQIMLKYTNFQIQKIFYCDINRVFIAQKQALKVLFRIKPYDSFRGVFKSNKILTVTEIHVQECLLHLWKNKDIFSPYLPSNHHSKRSMSYVYPHVQKGSNIKLFNSLLNSIKISRTLVEFKKQIHLLLIEIEPYNVTEY